MSVGRGVRGVSVGRGVREEQELESRKWVGGRRERGKKKREDGRW